MGAYMGRGRSRSWNIRYTESWQKIVGRILGKERVRDR